VTTNLFERLFRANYYKELYKDQKSN